MAYENITIVLALVCLGSLSREDLSIPGMRDSVSTNYGNASPPTGMRNALATPRVAVLIARSRVQFPRARTRRDELTQSRSLFEGVSSGGQLFPKFSFSAARAGCLRTDSYYLARINNSVVDAPRKDGIDHPFSISSDGPTLPLPLPRVEATLHRIAASGATGSFPIQATRWRHRIPLDRRDLCRHGGANIYQDSL